VILEKLKAHFVVATARRRSARGLMLGTVTGVLFALLLAGPAAAAPTPYESAVLGDSPAGYWRLGESSGTTAVDLSGNGHDGSFVGAPALGVPGAVAEDPNTAVAFNGASQYAQVPYTAALNPAAPFTVEAWAKVSGGAGSIRTVVGSRSFNPPRGYMLGVASTGEWQFAVGTGASGSSALIVTGPTSHPNTWTHLAGTVETIGTDLRVTLYVNGTFASQRTFSMTTFAPNPTQTLRIGADTSTAPARFFPGSVDELAVYNSALSAAQIANHFSKAAIFDVNTTSDTIDTNFNGVCADQNGQCSLRAAIIEADFLFGPAVIKLPAGTFTLTRGPADDEGKNCLAGAEYNSGDLDIYAPVTITGAGPGSTMVEMGTLSSTTTICGASAPRDRIFDVDNDGIGGPSYDGLDVTISGMTIRNGAAPVASGGTKELGGAIRYSGIHYDTNNRKGTLTLRDCAITNNTAASTGGGVWVAGGILSVSNCTFAGNTSQVGDGGGIALNGGLYYANTPPARAEITGTTFSGNRALRGGGSSTTGRGGAISLEDAPGPGFLRNSTLSGNSADAGGGGLMVSNASMALTNDTLTKNRSDADASNGGAGGGLNVISGTLMLGNSIVAGNFMGTGTTASNVGGSVAAGSSFNLIGTGGAGGLTNGANGNQVGVANPGLAPLADNGGSTQTHALLTGSSALDAGSNDLAVSAGLTADERGAPFARVLDSADAGTTATVDIGALEQHPSLPDIADQLMNAGTPFSVPFDVGDGNVGFDSIEASSSNTTLVPNSGLAVSGSGGSRTLTINSATGQAGTTTITVTATSTVGGKTLSTSDSFALTVNAPPTVAVTAPTDGSAFAAPSAITIDASASDSDGSVTQVDFYHDGVLIGTDTSAPYSASYTSPTIGTHSLTAVATDNRAATTTSSAVSITVHNPPTVSITSPTNGSIFVSSSPIAINADASDDGSVTQVDFYRDGVLIGTDTSAPYSASYTNPTAGSHSLTARATDNFGATTTSSEVSITVHDPPTVSFTSPTNGSVFVNPLSIPITASASDDGSVTRVDFMVDGVPIGTDTSSPYNATYALPTGGVHSLTARATDDNGATTAAAAWIEVFPAATNNVNAVLADSPTAYWRLNENRGTTVFDRAGNYNTGAFLRQPTLGATGALTGDSDTAVTFNGTTQYAELPYRSALNPAPPYSIEAWAKVTGGAGKFRTVLMSRSVSPMRGYMLFAGSDNHWQAWFGAAGTVWRKVIGPSVTLGAWTHLVVTVGPVSGGVQLTLYVDGAQAAQQTFPKVVANNSRPLRLAAGRTESTPIQYFPGTLDEIGFYNTALSAARVSAHYTTGTTG
jgi:sulfur relay (sulfurtransferase) complex TusBCD TusD component (DsrE family)